jgi:hypothetical protein
MRTQATLSMIGAAAALGAGGIAATGAVASSTTVKAPARHVEGRVVAINRPAHTFTVRDAERGTLKVKVTSNTKFERIAGFSALHRAERVDVRAARSNGSWNATVVERGGNVAGHNGADDPAGHQPGADDPAGHQPGADDPAGHQPGADDPAGHIGHNGADDPVNHI